MNYIWKLKILKNNICGISCQTKDKDQLISYEITSKLLLYEIASKLNAYVQVFYRYNLQTSSTYTVGICVFELYGAIRDHINIFPCLFWFLACLLAIYTSVHTYNHAYDSYIFWISVSTRQLLSQQGKAFDCTLRVLWAGVWLDGHSDRLRGLFSFSKLALAGSSIYFVLLLELSWLSINTSVHPWKGYSCYLSISRMSLNFGRNIIP